jgi:hypothetical protein
MCSGISSVPKISSNNRLKLNSKKDESRDCNQDQEKGMGREDYSRWFAFLVGGCSSRVVFSPCLPWLWGFFLEEEDERK